MEETEAGKQLKEREAARRDAAEAAPVGRLLAETEDGQESALAVCQAAVAERVHVNSLEMADVERGSILRELQRAYLERFAYLRSEKGGSLPPDEAREKAFEHLDEDGAARVLAHLNGVPVDSISFLDLAELWSASPHHAEGMWQMIKDEAQADFESGHMAAGVFAPVEWMREAWRKARYLGLRQSFVEEWQPRGGIELALVDMLAQSFFQYLYWTEESVKRSQTEPRREAEDYIQWKAAKAAEREASGWGPGYWDIPYVCEQRALEHAAQMADRYNRLFLRTLRQLRDLRRYAPPVIVNNGGQVNVANQQVNLSGENHK